jgi:hypothetical protein
MDFAVPDFLASKNFAISECVRASALLGHRLRRRSHMYSCKLFGIAYSATLMPQAWMSCLGLVLGVTVQGPR